MMGKRTVVKLPWKQKKGETYYNFELLNGKWIVHLLWWIDSPNEYALLDKGWIYRTLCVVVRMLLAEHMSYG